MMKRLLLCFLIALNLQPSFGLSIGDIPRIVEEKSNELKAKRLDLLAEQIDVRNQPFAWLPDLALSYKGNFSSLFLDDFSHSHTIELASSLSLSDTQVFEDRIERMEYNKMLIDYEKSYQELLYNILVLYVDALKKQTVMTLARTNESVSKMNYEYAQSKNSQGTISDIELINAEADYDDSVYLSRKSQLEFDTAVSQLKRELGDETITVEPLSLADFSYISEEHPSIKQLLQGDAASLAIKSGETTLNILKTYNLLALRSLWLPSLNLGFSLNYDACTYNSVTGEWTGLDPKFNTALTLTATIPIFSGNEKRIGVEKSELAIRKSLISLDSLKAAFREDVARLIDLHNRSVDLLNISKKRISSASREYEKKKESYKLGLIPILDLLETKDSYMEKEKESASFSLDIILLRAKIGLACGDTFLFLR